MTDRSHRTLARLRAIGVAALAAAALGPAACAAEPLPAHAPVDMVRERVVQLVNAARSRPRKCGSEKFAAAPPLDESPLLDDAAAEHARDMVRRKFFDHRGSDDSQPRDRVQRVGYKSRLTGENIALGPESAEEVVAGWLDSPGHCANIMEPRFHDIGVGIASGKQRGQIYWVQNFGAPR